MALVIWILVLSFLVLADFQSSALVGDQRSSDHYSYIIGRTIYDIDLLNVCLFFFKNSLKLFFYKNL